MVVAAASHTVRGSLATGRTAALAVRSNDSPPFPKARRKKQKSKNHYSVRQLKQKKKVLCFLTDHE